MEKVTLPFNKEFSQKTYRILNFLYAKFIKPNFRVKQVPKLETKFFLKDDKLVLRVELDMNTIHIKDRDEIDTFIKRLVNEIQN